MTDQATINPDDLAERTTAADDLFALVFGAGGPLQKLRLGALLSKLIATSLCKATQAALAADLAHAADTVALVFNDPTTALNGWYRKTGASGSGSWVQFEELSKAVRTAAAASAALAQAWAEGTAPGGAGTKSAREWADALAAAGIATTALANVAGAVQDICGRWWTQDRPNGEHWIAKPCDGAGRRIDQAIDANTARIVALEAANLVLPPPQRLRLRKSLYYGGLLARSVYAVDPVTVGSVVVGGAGDTVTQMASPVSIEPDDARIRLLGGPWQRGSMFPYQSVMIGQAITNGDPATAGNTGLPASRYSWASALEFTLPAGQTQIELKMMGVGANQPFLIDIDGVGTNAAGYMAGVPNNLGHVFFIPITFPPSASARVIRMFFPQRYFAGLSIEAGGTLGPKPVPRVPSSAAFLGDSITAGSIASNNQATWAARTARKLGIDNFINLGIGGSGWCARYPYVEGRANLTAGSVSATLTSGAFISGQFIDGAGIAPGTTATIAGTTLTLSAPASASGTDVPVRISSAYSFFERTRDVLQAVDGGAPDMLVIAGGINDLGVAAEGFWTQQQLGARALGLLRALRDAAPDMAMFVVGPFTDWNNPSYSATLYATRDTLFAAAAQVPRVHTIDVSGLVTPANRDVIFNGSNVNGPHPVDAGHVIYSDFIASSIAGIINQY